jgi:hypothetical protein
VEAVQISYELAVPLDQLPATTSFETGTDLVRLLGLVGSLEQFQDDKPREVDWRVVETNGRSATLCSYSEPDVASRAALSVVRGFKDAERNERLPHAWSLAAGKRAERVAARLGDTADTGLRLVVGGAEPDEVRVTRQASRHLQEATKLRFTSYGSVLGVLGRVTARGRNRTAALWSDLDGRRVEVRFGEDHVEDMRDAWAHKHVEVTGVLHENAAGQVLRVNMDSLTVLDRAKTSLLATLPRGFYRDDRRHEYRGLPEGDPWRGLTRSLELRSTRD